MKVSSSLTTWILAVALAAAGTWYYIRWNSDTARIERRFAALLEAAGKHGPESLPVAAGRIYEVLSSFTPDARIRLGEPLGRTLDKQDLSAVLQRGRSQADTLAFESLGHEMERESNHIFHMDATLEGRITQRGAEEKALGTYRLTWVHINGNWLIKRIESIDVIRHPGVSAW